MESHDSDPDVPPDETPVASNGNQGDHSSDQSDDRLPLSRRAALASVVGISSLSALSNPAAAKGTKTWKRDRDAQGHELIELGTLAMQANPTPISSFEGDGLTIDRNGVLNASDTRTNVSDVGGDTVENVEDINFAANLTVTDDSDGSATVDADTWDSKVDAGGNDLVQIGGLQTLINKTKIKDFEGANLTIDSNNLLNADTWDSDVDAGENSLTGADTVEANNISVGNVGGAVFFSGTVSGVGHEVQFHSKKFDHQDEFNLAENEFEAADDGFYQVSARVIFDDFSKGESAQLRRAIRKGTTTTFRTVDLAERDADRDDFILNDVVVSYSSLHQLNEGDGVFFRLNRTGSADESYGGGMEVHQVG